MSKLLNYGVVFLFIRTAFQKTIDYNFVLKGGPSSITRKRDYCSIFVLLTYRFGRDRQVLPSPALLERNVLICGPELQVLPMPLFELENSTLFVHTLNEEEQFWDIYLPDGYSSRH